MQTRKIYITGILGVGKTSIVKRIIHNTFDKAYDPTPGHSLYNHEEEMPNGSKKHLEFIDLSGDPKYEYNHPNEFITGLESKLAETKSEDLLAFVFNPRKPHEEQLDYFHKVQKLSQAKKKGIKTIVIHTQALAPDQVVLKQAAEHFAPLFKIAEEDFSYCDANTGERSENLKSRLIRNSPGVDLTPDQCQNLAEYIEKTVVEAILTAEISRLEKDHPSDDYGKRKDILTNIKKQITEVVDSIKNGSLNNTTDIFVALNRPIREELDKLKKYKGLLGWLSFIAKAIGNVIKTALASVRSQPKPALFHVYGKSHQKALDALDRIQSVVPSSKKRA